jgi:antitoxin ParD1/3/4
MAAARPMNITLPDDLAAQVRARVASGQYASEYDVIRESLSVLEDRETSVDNWLRNEVLPIHDAMLADPSRARSVEDVRATLASLREKREQ